MLEPRRDPFIQGVRLLAEELEARWHAVAYDHERFPSLAAAALSQHRCQEVFDFDRFVDWYLAGAGVPSQHLYSDFGDPPLRVFLSDRFYIEVLVWHKASPNSIHDHAFCGAWEVLKGRTFHSKFQFAEEASLHKRLFLGQLSPLGYGELLEVGTVTEIPAGSQGLIHRTDYLSRPTVSLLVRTHDNARSNQYQRTYFPWGVATGFTVTMGPHEDRHLTRCLKLLEFHLGNGDAEALDRYAGSAIATMDPREAFQFSEAYYRSHFPGPDRLLGLLHRAGSIDRRFVPTIARSIEACALYFISVLSLHDEQDRLIFASLCARPHKSEFLRQMARAFPAIEGPQLPAFLAQRIHALTNTPGLPFALNEQGQCVLQAHLETASREGAWQWISARGPAAALFPSREAFDSLCAMMSAAECLKSILEERYPFALVGAS